jgi:hypothetical protein
MNDFPEKISTLLPIMAAYSPKYGASNPKYGASCANHTKNNLLLIEFGRKSDKLSHFMKRSLTT